MNKKVFVEWNNDDQQLNFEMLKLELNDFYRDRISYCILNNPHFLLFDFYKRLPEIWMALTTP